MKAGSVFPVRKIVRAGVIAAIYVVLCWLLRPISFGWVQLRLAEALTVLPILWVEAVPALYVGTLVANIIGGLGVWDIFGGSLVTLLAAVLTRLYRRSWLAYLWPIVLNGFLVSLYLYKIYGVPYWMTVVSISISEALVVLLVGVPLLRVLRQRGLADET